MAKLDYLSTLPANKPPCWCGKHAWYVSQKVQRRILNCPKCLSSFWYIRELGNKWVILPLGGFKNKAEQEGRLAEYGKEYAR